MYALPCLTPKEKCNLVAYADPNGILLIEELQPEIGFDVEELCWLLKNQDKINEVNGYVENNSDVPKGIIKSAVEHLKYAPEIGIAIAVALAEAEEELGEYSKEEDMPSITGWLSCESFEFEETTVPFEDLHRGGVDALYFSWFVPQVSNYKSVGPFSMDVFFKASCTHDQAEWCSSWAANRAGKIVGFIAAADPGLSDLVIKNAFIATFNQGLTKHTPMKCNPVEASGGILASELPSRATAIFYSNFADWLIHCGF